MADSSVVSLADIREAYSQILPRTEDKNVMCGQLLRSIGYCESVGSSAWSVSLLNGGFRLNVGQVEVLTCFYSFWDRSELGPEQNIGFLDFRFLISGPDAEPLAECIDPDLVQRMGYRSVSEDHWAIQVTLIVEGETSAGERAEVIQLIEDVQRAHLNFVIRAAHTPAGSLRKRSNFARFNCEALVTYAREEIGAIPYGTPVTCLDSVPVACPCDLV